MVETFNTGSVSTGRECVLLTANVGVLDFGRSFGSKADKSSNGTVLEVGNRNSFLFSC
jgi:hypothetical protein